ncbi:CxC2 domain-containing protein [Mycena kentingensis (nom. inval.)]|nr:CxC2 domain-containing protein [Mycena kentingensis (nom. inval.)]
MVEAFESDPTQPNPYQSTTEGLTERQVRDKFEEEEARKVAAGRVPIHEVGPAEFMESLLHVEDEQRRARNDPTQPLQSAMVMEVPTHTECPLPNGKLCKAPSLAASIAALRNLKEILYP